MARAFRLAGAILAETDGDYYLVGQTKEPCDWPAAGFAVPRTLESGGPWFVKLDVRGSVSTAAPVPGLVLPLEGEALARALAQRFVIERNGSVSERLWRIAIHRGDPDAEDGAPGDVDARWLAEIPAPVWQMVRDTVLRCV
jgi:hypothetical protein